MDLQLSSDVVSTMRAHSGLGQNKQVCVWQSLINSNSLDCDFYLASCCGTQSRILNCSAKRFQIRDSPSGCSIRIKSLQRKLLFPKCTPFSWLKVTLEKCEQFSLLFREFICRGGKNPALELSTALEVAGERIPSFCITASLLEIPAHRNIARIIILGSIVLKFQGTMKRWQMISGYNGQTCNIILLQKMQCTSN